MTTIIRRTLANARLVCQPPHRCVSRPQTLSPYKGQVLMTQACKRLLEVSRPMLKSLIREINGANVSSMYRDISTATREERNLFPLGAK